MSETVNNSLEKIAKGSTIILIGTMVSLLLGFIGRLILIRFTTQYDFGIYCLALTLVSILTTISTMGLGEGSTRYIAYLKGKSKNKLIPNAIISSIVITLSSSALIFIIAFFFSDFIATNIFHSSELSNIINIFLITIPFTAFSGIIISIFRSFDQFTIKVYFNDIMKPIIHIIFLGIVVFFARSLSGMASAYLMSIIIPSIIISIYFLKKHKLFGVEDFQFIDKSMIKELLTFSIPLLAVSIILTLMSWTDTLMLGYFKTAKDVGIYNSAVPLANLLTIIIGSLSFVYVPVMSQLYGKNQIRELGRSYVVSTKWCFIGTLPLFFILFVFPDFILNLFFGPRYISASIVLQILSLEFIINSYFGLNYYTLMTVGKSKFLMNCSLVGAVMNILLNIILIPIWGVAGAAIASTLSFVFIEILMSIKLYTILKIHPFTTTYLKLTILSIILISIFSTINDHTVASFWTFLVISFTFMLTFVLSLLFAHILDDEDVIITSLIKKKLGFNFFR
ncbi:hypothetical protein LI82_10155 [Methanococcoides methylutens]|uniref:Uncharacterized protein n=1 Tax=Methanococcoides methylutens TaxID=2226 RepID=A0A099SYY6_METMT|nr:flippase [Methanococcoides methylutens]KGK98092.1 hypothetical protein LI82_10155 [Methanococcoides methylutens]